MEAGGKAQSSARFGGRPHRPQDSAAVNCATDRDSKLIKWLYASLGLLRVCQTSKRRLYNLSVKLFLTTVHAGTRFFPPAASTACFRPLAASQYFPKTLKVLDVDRRWPLVIAGKEVTGNCHPWISLQVLKLTFGGPHDGYRSHDGRVRYD